jgi:hypothetical protein
MTSSRARVSEPYRHIEQSSQRSRSTAPQRNIKNLPRRNAVPLPAWLQVLLSLQKLSIASTVMLTVAVFGVYGWSVYTQEAWNSNHKKLEQLQKQERQLVESEAFLSHDLTKKFQTQPGDLVRESPERSIFLESAPTRPSRSPAPTVADTGSSTKKSTPVGY